MKLVHTIAEVREATSSARASGTTVGLVPTMGALHDGHLSLVNAARRENGFVAVSIFVNPAQFAPSEDLAKYPRTLDQDTEECEAAGVDLVFAPNAQEMYPRGFDSWVDVGGVTEMLEGKFRPTHFRGVATVCLKLFSIFRPDAAYFGRKDYQQLRVMEKMVSDLNLPLRIVPCDIIRETDGLAMSSRNRYLSSEERKAALCLSQSLADAEAAYQSGERSAMTIQHVVKHRLDAEPLAEIDYAVVVDAETLLPIETIIRPAVVLLAVRIGSTRLIDNTVLVA